MSNRNQSDGSLLALRLRAQTLTKQLEELQQLRDRVNRAEAKAVAGRRGKHLGRLVVDSSLTGKPHTPIPGSRPR
jgi:hypothetical protein